MILIVISFTLCNLNPYPEGKILLQFEFDMLRLNIGHHVLI